MFVGLWVKINGTYYRTSELEPTALPVISKISGEIVVTHQDKAPTHRAFDIISLLELETSFY